MLIDIFCTGNWSALENQPDLGNFYSSVRVQTRIQSQVTSARNGSGALERATWLVTNEVENVLWLSNFLFFFFILSNVLWNISEPTVDGVDQWGVMFGTYQDSSLDIEKEIYLRSLRQRRWGQNNASTLRRLIRYFNGRRVTPNIRLVLIGN